MAASIPRPIGPSHGPPTTALPALPLPKTRRSVGAVPTASNLRAGALAKSGLRSPSATVSPAGNTTSLPKLKTTSTGTKSLGVNSAGKTIRKQVSINAFPQPPRSGPSGFGVRTSSLPPSPLSGGLTPASAGEGFNRRESSESVITPSGISKKSKGPRSTQNLRALANGATTSLLNGSFESGSISSGPGARGSDGLLSLPSPPHSRSSSAQDSYSTSATTLEENAESRGRDTSGDTTDEGSKPIEGKGNVIVSVRVRPDATTGAAKTDGEWMVDGRRSLVAYKGREGGDYYYDNVFATHDNNAKVYDSSAKRLVRRVMEGYHGTVFAYGMTGTGKTFSMQGTATSPGVIPLAITDIFSYIRETPSREFLLRVSYLEIYNEKIHDLLSPPPAGSGPGAPQQEEIKLREDAKRGVYASPLKEEIVQSPTQLLRVIARGDNARRTSSTQFNARSSRSHAVVQIVVESRERIPGSGAMGDKRVGLVPGGVRVSTLSLIDLAGSERAAETKERRTEGSHINKSLLTLGTVIARLSGDKDKDGKPTDKDGKHLPYRDSKLTRLLQGALSGDSLVSILCTVQIGSAGSAAAMTTHIGETLNTLKFASRAKNNIVSHAKKAEEALGAGGDGGARVLLERYRMEILELRGQLQGQQHKSVDDEDEKEREKEAEQRHEEQMLEMHLARTALKERIEHLNRLILSSKSTGVNASGSYSSLSMHPRLSTMNSSGHLSSMSARSSMAHSFKGRNSLERTTSNASVSTVGQLKGPRRTSSGTHSMEDDDSHGEYGDGSATLLAQNQALQADLADKNRYCQTLEKRLLQARRSSHSRTSAGFSSSPKMGSIMVGEDHGVASLLKEKDSEIADLRARLDDKDRMLNALQSAARSRESADRDPRTALTLKMLESGPLSPVSARTSQLAGLQELGPPPLSPLPATPSNPKSRKPTKTADEMSKLLDEMIQDRVEKGEVVYGNRPGSVRVASERRPTITLEPMPAGLRPASADQATAVKDI